MTRPPTIAMLAATAAATTMAVVMAGCSGGSGGPKNIAGLDNASQTWIAVRLWTGRPGPGPDAPPTDMRRVDELLVGPGGKGRLEIPPLPLVSTDRPIVRLQLEAVGPKLKTGPGIWYELPAPGPFVLRAEGQGEQVWFARIRGRAPTVSPLEGPGDLVALSPLARDMQSTLDGAAVRSTTASTTPAGREAWMPTLGPELPPTASGLTPGGPVGPTARPGKP